MPRADYRCPACGDVREDVYFPAAAGATASAPPCVACAQPRSDGFDHVVLMEPIPAANFDLRTDGDGDRAGQKFTVHRQIPTRTGLQQVSEVIDSAHARRRIEKDSEQRYRDGEGEPLRFRMDHQSASNMDTNSFGASGRVGARTYDSGAAPQKQSNISTTRHGSRKPRIPLGPGLAGRSPLKG